uniref:F-box domain-containing protein n=1 Tax=Chlamydomonas leiostraca TaxID=1034604 RepID=A0A7S0WZF3_9CHLO|mmetsp:Transcript_4079/g.10195  ORF Transcript_4079/g.10195 Transcript_4079/m.10195 type:complete len:390 (+) Transcript_4079:39-1208(+)
MSDEQEDDIKSSAFQWDDLPFELRTEVASKIDSERTLTQLCSSSYALKQLGDTTWQWKELFLRRYPGLVRLLSSSRRWRALVRSLSHSPASWQALHRELRSGRTFQAQVRNREVDNSAEDFTHSCYDATVRYQGVCPSTGQPLFTARYLPMGKERVEEPNITLGRLRPVPEGTHPHRVHPWRVADVREGEEVEVQWRGDMGHPFGWWFGVVRRVLRASVVIEFPQYPAHSPWRSVLVPVSTSKDGAVNVDQRWGYLGGLRQLSEAEKAEWGQATRATSSAPGAGAGAAAGAAGSADDGADAGGVVAGSEAAPGGGGGAPLGGMAAVLARAVEAAEAAGLDLDLGQLVEWVAASQAQLIAALQAQAHTQMQAQLGGAQAEPGGWLLELVP